MCTWNVGWEQVKTGENGCGWVRMGALGHRGHGKHKNRLRRVNLGSHRWGFGCHGRGNFPGHDVLGPLSKMVKDEWAWVQIGLDGCACMHKRVWGTKTRQKEMQMGKQGLFLNACPCSKNTMCCQRWLWHWERVKGRNKGQMKCALCDSMYLSNGETAKQRERWKKKVKPVRTNVVTQGQKCNKKYRHKISKVEANKMQQHHKTNCHVQSNKYSKPKPQKEAMCDDE